MKKPSLIENLSEFIKKYSGRIITNPQEILDSCDKGFLGTGMFNKYSKELIKIIIENDKPVLSFPGEGIIISSNSFYIIVTRVGSTSKSLETFKLNQIEGLSIKSMTFWSGGEIKVGNKKITSVGKTDENMFNELVSIMTRYNNDVHMYDIYQLDLKNNMEQEIKTAEATSLLNSKNNIINDLDQNNDGIVDLISNEFNKLFSKNQKRVMEMDKTYIHQFVKVSNFIKTKKQNTQKIFESIRDTSSKEELEERVNLLKNQIHAYELLVFHSINMIGALVSEDLITFYEIYESFDKLGMFNSNWENEVSEKLTNIGDKLDDLMYSIYNMEQSIVSELSHLSYITQESFEDLNRSVTNQLREVESSINTNNLLTGIQTYQLYKINKNTKGLR
jgi:hypothetical protein